MLIDFSLHNVYLSTIPKEREYEILKIHIVSKFEA